MRVILQQNLNKNMNLVNGAQGVIVGFKPCDELRMPKEFIDGLDCVDPKVPSFIGSEAMYREKDIKEYAK